MEIVLLSLGNKCSSVGQSVIAELGTKIILRHLKYMIFISITVPCRRCIFSKGQKLCLPKIISLILLNCFPKIRASYQHTFQTLISLLWGWFWMVEAAALLGRGTGVLGLSAAWSICAGNIRGGEQERAGGSPWKHMRWCVTRCRKMHPFWLLDPIL